LLLLLEGHFRLPPSFLVLLVLFALLLCVALVLSDAFVLFQVLLLGDLLHVLDDVHPLLLEVLTREGLLHFDDELWLRLECFVLKLVLSSQSTESSAVGAWSRLAADIAEHLLWLREPHLATAEGAREVEMPVTVLLLTSKCRSQLSTEGALLVDELLLLVVEVDDLSLFNVEHFLRPQGTAHVHVHIHLVGDQPPSHRELTLLLAEEAGEVLLGVNHFEVFSAGYF